MSFTNCEICGRVMPAAETSTGVFLKTYCGCDKSQHSPSRSDSEEWDRIKRMTADQIKEELDSKGISTTSAVSHVLEMVRDAKEKQMRRKVERN